MIHNNETTRALCELLWRVTGESKHGAFTCKVRAPDHAAAISKAAPLPHMRVRDCVLIEETKR
jgi:hypothetical protein